jgi:hypothetical protein
MNRNPPRWVNIVVSSGSGTGTIYLDGVIASVYFKASSSSSMFDGTVSDLDSMKLAGALSIVGEGKVDAVAQAYGPHTVSITNATVDGTYKVKIWYR